MKKLLTLLLSLALFIPLSISAFAADDTTNSNIISDDEVQSYALNFMTTSQSNENITIDNFIHLYDTTDQLTGYYITFSNHETPAGYILLSLISDENPIVEFSFEGTGPLYTNSVSTSVMSITDDISNNNANSKILYTGPGQLYIETHDNTLYSLYDQKYIPLTSFISSCADKVNLYDGIINWNQASIKGTPYKITNFGAGTDYYLMTDFSKGNVCTPTAATNVLWYWGQQRGCSSVMNKCSSNAVTIFNILSNAMGTDTTLGTPDNKILNGYQTFFGESAGNGTWSYKKISNGSSYSTYQAALNNNCPIHLVLHTNDSPSDKGKGHCVMTFGYAGSTAGSKYLFVMDGWNTYGRFVKFNYYPYFWGYKIWVA